MSCTFECTCPKSSPCTWGGVGNGAGDVEGKGQRTEQCSMSQNGEGVEMVKCVETGEVMLPGSGSRVKGDSGWIRSVSRASKGDNWSLFGGEAVG